MGNWVLGITVLIYVGFYSPREDFGWVRWDQDRPVAIGIERVLFFFGYRENTSTHSVVEKVGVIEAVVND